MLNFGACYARSSNLQSLHCQGYMGLFFLVFTLCEREPPLPPSAPTKKAEFKVIQFWTTLGLQWPILIIFPPWDHERIRNELWFITILCPLNPMTLWDKTFWWNISDHTLFLEMVSLWGKGQPQKLSSLLALLHKILVLERSVADKCSRSCLQNHR